MGGIMGIKANHKQLLGAMVLVGLLIQPLGCSNKSSSNSGTSPSNTGSATSGYVPPTYGGGATATLTAVNNIILSQYVGYPVTASSTIYINVNTTSINGVYLGEASISFQDTNGGSHNGNFKSGLDSSHGNDKNVLTTHSVTGARAVRLFFEDPLGVIAVVVTDGSSGADNLPLTLNGEVYFRNFNSSAPNPLYQGYTDMWGNYWPANPYAFCWSGQISTGPYDCQNLSVPPATSGDKAFTLLGSFYGLDKAALGL